MASYATAGASAVVAVAVAMGAERFTHPTVGAILMAAVLLAARCGVGPGVLAAGITAAALQRFWSQPADGLGWLATYVAVSAFVIWSTVGAMRAAARVRAAGQRLLREEARLAGIVETAMDAIISVDVDGRVIIFNRAAEEMFCVDARNIVSRPIECLIPERLRDAHNQGMRDFSRGTAAQRSLGSLTGLRSDGTEFPVAATVSKAYDGPHRGPHGPRGVVLTMIMRDMSERAEREAERERQLVRERRMRAEAEALAVQVAAASSEESRLRVAADEANYAKSAFLAMMSHELRTPLNAIGGYVQLIEMGLHGPVTPEQAGALVRVQKNQARLLALINGILDYAKLEAGQIAMVTEVCDAGSVAAEAEAAVLPAVQNKRITLADTELQDHPLSVRADAARLTQILVNLLANAVKFTPDGGTVEIGGHQEGSFGYITVTDTGVGIPDDKLEAVFDPFVQVTAGPEGAGQYAKKDGQGTGLGLSISRGLARAMGGDITVLSAVGLGSTFSVRLPLGKLPSTKSRKVLDKT